MTSLSPPRLLRQAPPVRPVVVTWASHAAANGDRTVRLAKGKLVELYTVREFPAEGGRAWGFLKTDGTQYIVYHEHSTGEQTCDCAGGCWRPERQCKHRVAVEQWLELAAEGITREPTTEPVADAVVPETPAVAPAPHCDDCGARMTPHHAGGQTYICDTCWAIQVGPMVLADPDPEELRERPCEYCQTLCADDRHYCDQHCLLAHIGELDAEYAAVLDEQFADWAAYQ